MNFYLRCLLFSFFCASLGCKSYQFKNSSLRYSRDDEPGAVTEGNHNGPYGSFDPKNIADPNHPENPANVNRPSNGPALTDLPSGDKIIYVACDKTITASPMLIKGTAQTKITVKGDLCPISMGQFTALLVVDWSNSMELSDPIVNGTCGRMEAIKAIVNKFFVDSGGGAGVKLMLLAFASNAYRIIGAPTDLAGFVPLMQPDKICSFQKSWEGLTNYFAAMVEAKNMLTPIQGPKVMYFISDGLATWGGNPANNKPSIDDNGDGDFGFAAARDILSTNPQFVPFYVFLVPKSGATAAQGLAYLTRLAGNQNQVRVANTAQDLAAKIVELSIPPPALKPETTTANLNFQGQVKALQIALAIDPQRARRYKFESDPFVPVSQPTGPSAQKFALACLDVQGKPNVVGIDFVFAIDPALSQKTPAGEASGEPATIPAAGAAGKGAGLPQRP